MQKEWIFNKTEFKKKSLIERLLEIRGITQDTDVQEFLNPLEMDISDPTAFCDMEKAVGRIFDAIDKQEKILVYGDFDADGVTSTSVLIKTLKELGANVDYYIPDREEEGHGLNSKHLVKLMTDRDKKPKLIITVDCGISSIKEVTFLNSFKIDVIITDHHEAGEELPNAYAIINPKAPNALDENLTAKKIIELASLAGVGVAFKLATALLKAKNRVEFIYNILPLVAVGTIADIVPLIGENRYLVAKGLELISQGKHYGLKRLLEEAGYKLENGITSEQIAFGVAPRINATGRLSTVESAMKLMLSDNKQEIEMAIITLNDYNRIRQELCDSTFLEADEMLKKENKDDNAIVLFNPNWHIGIIGIVASKLVEKYYKPTFLMTYHEGSKQYRCSARSVKGVNLFDTISANSEKLDGFGGHEMAAGLSFSEENITFEELKTGLNKTITESLAGKQLKPFVNIDLELTLDDLDLNLVDEISKLEPFGASNPSPIFAIKNVTLKEKRLMGSNNNHLRLTVIDGNNEYNCIWWSHGDISLLKGDKLDVAFAPQLNTYKDNTSLQLILQDVHSEHLKDENDEQDENKNAVKLFDHRKKTDILQQVNDYVKTSKLDILVFAEDKAIIETMKSAKALSEKIVTRKTIRKADSIMFFDYPATEEFLNGILETVQPKHIHIMNYPQKAVDEQKLLKTMSGMIKFVCNNRDGKFAIGDAAISLATTNEVVETLLNLFADCKMIEIKDQNEEFYNINFVSNIEISKLLHSLKYTELKTMLEEIEDSKRTIYENGILEIA